MKEEEASVCARRRYRARSSSPPRDAGSCCAVAVDDLEPPVAEVASLSLDRSCVETHGDEPVLTPLAGSASLGRSGAEASGLIADRASSVLVAASAASLQIAPPSHAESASQLSSSSHVCVDSEIAERAAAETKLAATQFLTSMKPVRGRNLMVRRRGRSLAKNGSTRDWRIRERQCQFQF